MNQNLARFIRTKLFDPACDKPQRVGVILGQGVCILPWQAVNSIALAQSVPQNPVDKWGRMASAMAAGLDDCLVYGRVVGSPVLAAVSGTAQFL